MKKNKKMTALAATVLAITMLVSGTLAWQQMVSKTNEFIGSKETPTLHDDFDAAADMKDVYVENTAERPLFVRVKLDEWMKLGSRTRPTNPAYTAHTFGASAIDCGHDNADSDLFHDCFHWIMGGQKFYMPAAGTSGVKSDTTIYDGTEQGVAQTPNAAIIKIADFLALTAPEQAAFIGWVYDADGYAYWAQPLLKGEVTGLLLHGVETDSTILGIMEYYYAIDVKVEAVDREDLAMWTTGAESADGSHTTYPVATNEGKTFLAWIVTQLPQP